MVPLASLHRVGISDRVNDALQHAELNGAPTHLAPTERDDLMTAPTVPADLAGWHSSALRAAFSTDRPSWSR